VNEDPAGPGAPGSFWSRFGWLLAAVWVVFLIFPILSIAQSTLPPPARVAGYGLVAAFAAVYLWGFFTYSSELGVSASGHARAWIPFGTLLAITGATIPILGADVISLGPFLISFAAYLLSMRTMWIANAVVLSATLWIALPAGLGNYVFLLGMLVVLVVVNAVNTALIRRSIVADDLRLDYAMLAEQERMARDVHDVLGHSLTAIGLKAELAERLLETDLDAARAELRQIRALNTEALESIRATVGGLRRTTVAQELVSVRAALDDAGVRTVLIGNVKDIDSVRSTALSWILREAVTNVLRHAHATTCWIHIAPGVLGIEDDGDSLSGSHEGHGIRGMRERARLAGAHCEIGTSAHGGTKVAVSWA
jgi:two-component system sensor histidine kinase DesK